MSRFVALLAAVLLLTATPFAAQERPAPIAGKWTGSVKADLGEMPIEVALTIQGEAVTGEIKTFHGMFKITSGALQKDGRWQLKFVTEDGAAGTMTGAVKGDAFAGDWDFRPQAVGTFALTRAK